MLLLIITEESWHIMLHEMTDAFVHANRFCHICNLIYTAPIKHFFSTKRSNMSGSRPHWPNVPWIWRPRDASACYYYVSLFLLIAFFLVSTWSPSFAFWLLLPIVLLFSPRFCLLFLGNPFCATYYRASNRPYYFGRNILQISFENWNFWNLPSCWWVCIHRATQRTILRIPFRILLILLIKNMESPSQIKKKKKKKNQNCWRRRHLKINRFEPKISQT